MANKQTSWIPADELFYLEPIAPENTSDMIDSLSENSREAIFCLYHDMDDSFVVREAHKAFIYYDINPDKRPKNRRHWTTARLCGSL